MEFIHLLCLSANTMHFVCLCGEGTTDQMKNLLCIRDPLTLRCLVKTASTGFGGTIKTALWSFSRGNRVNRIKLAVRMAAFLISSEL